MTRRLSIALCDDFREEGWPSMDRVAETLHAALVAHHASEFSVERIAPEFARAATAMPLVGEAHVATKIDRFVNRFLRYPQHARTLTDRFDVFHIVDHSYAHVAHALPAERTVITCHDLDAFRSILEPEREPRSEAFRLATRRVLTGLQRAARVMCDTAAVRDQLVGANLISASKIVVAPLGVDDAFFAETRDADAASGAIELLHVGSTAPRKRIDVLLRIVASLAPAFPRLRLVRVGDPLTDEHRALARNLGVADRIDERGLVDEATLPSLYRDATLVLQPSDREGFGFPVIEALASGTPVVASDLAVLREVGGAAVTFVPVGDDTGWASAVASLLRERADCPAQWDARRAAGRTHARRFTWSAYADIVAAVYRGVAAAVPA
ncbi:MAG TPA: glycosyltransferase family 1 protein [Vicinamibacterales bacterium]|nr:glycosyltransferase family 1 protein [Vicinamibacterales bacterium]